MSKDLKELKKIFQNKLEKIKTDDDFYNFIKWIIEIDKKIIDETEKK